MINILNKLKENGKRDKGEAELTFLSSFYLLLKISDDFTNLPLSNMELNVFKDYFNNKKRDVIIDELRYMFNKGLIGKNVLEIESEKTTIISDFFPLDGFYPNIVNIKDSLIFTTNNRANLFLKMQNEIFGLKNNLQSFETIKEDKSTYNHFKNLLSSSEKIIISSDFMLNTRDKEIFSFFKEADLDDFLKTKDLYIVGDYNGLGISKQYLHSCSDGVLCFNYSKPSLFDEKFIKTIPYDFISKFTIYSSSNNDLLPNNIIGLIAKKFNINNKTKNISDYLTNAYYENRESFNSIIFEQKEKKEQELKELKNEIANINSFLTNNADEKFLTLMASKNIGYIAFAYKSIFHFFNSYPLFNSATDVEEKNIEHLLHDYNKECVNSFNKKEFGLIAKELILESNLFNNTKDIDDCKITLLDKKNNEKDKFNLFIVGLRDKFKIAPESAYRKAFTVVSLGKPSEIFGSENKAIYLRNLGLIAYGFNYKLLESNKSVIDDFKAPTNKEEAYVYDVLKYIEKDENISKSTSLLNDLTNFLVIIENIKEETKYVKEFKDYSELKMYLPNTKSFGEYLKKSIPFLKNNLEKSPILLDEVQSIIKDSGTYKSSQDSALDYLVKQFDDAQVKQIENKDDENSKNEIQNNKRKLR